VYVAQVERLQAIVTVKDACIKNYTNYIKDLQSTAKSENGALTTRVTEVRIT
jgi:hypothetical protein